MQLYLAAAPGLLSRAQKFAVPVAHAAYRVDDTGHLTAQDLPAQLRGGLLMLCGREAPLVRSPETLCREILQECQRRDFGGVVLDYEGAPSSPSIRLMRLLETELRRRQKRLYVPELWGDHARQSAVLIGTAVSGGSLRQRLEEAVGRYAPRPVALYCQRLAMDFLLPSPNGEGSALTLDQLARLREGHTVYFSPDLCARYFTYRARTHTHFVLFDDADTLQRKLTLGEDLGIKAAFFMLPEVDDLVGKLFGR